MISRVTYLTLCLLTLIRTLTMISVITDLLFVIKLYLPIEYRLKAMINRYVDTVELCYNMYYSVDSISISRLNKHKEIQASMDWNRTHSFTEPTAQEY